MEQVTLIITCGLGIVAGRYICLIANCFLPLFTIRQWTSAIIYSVSTCVSCHRPVSLWHRFFYFYRGKTKFCQHYQTPLSWRSVFFMSFTAISFAITALSALPVIPRLTLLFFTAVLILLSDIDWRFQYLPDALTLPLLWVGLVQCLLFSPSQLADAVTGVAAGWVSLTLLSSGFKALRKIEGLGGGDIKLFAALGAWNGWQALPAIAILASGAGLLLFTAQRIMTGKNAVSLRQAFGPCLAAAGWGTLLIKQLHLAAA